MLLRVDNNWLFLTTIGINCVQLDEEKPIWKHTQKTFDTHIQFYNIWELN